jgi:hypothetical protein
MIRIALATGNPVFAMQQKGSIRPMPLRSSRRDVPDG